MSQGDVVEILEKKKTWMTAKEIARHLKQGEGSIRVNLKNLLRQREIQQNKVPGEKGGWQSVYKLEDSKSERTQIICQ